MTTPLRADARRNRERIVTAARQAFGEEGLDVGVEAIARRAGVGMGTLYRRFPTKEALIDAIFEERLEELAPVIARAQGDPDAWEGFSAVVQEAVALQASDHGFLQEIARRLAPGDMPPSVQERFFAPLAELFARAQASGAAREDITPADLRALVRMAGGAALLPESAADRRRHVGVLLDGLRAR